MTTNDLIRKLRALDPDGTMDVQSYDWELDEWLPVQQAIVDGDFIALHASATEADE